MFITTAMTVSFHAYVLALSYGIEHSSLCKKAVDYFVLFDTWEQECMWKGSIWIAIEIL